MNVPEIVAMKLPIMARGLEKNWGVATARDGKSILYLQDEFAESNIVLVKKFDKA